MERSSKHWVYFSELWSRNGNAELVFGLNEIIYVKPTTTIIAQVFNIRLGYGFSTHHLSGLPLPKDMLAKDKNLYRTTHVTEYLKKKRYLTWRSNQKRPLLSGSSFPPFSILSTSQYRNDDTHGRWRNRESGGRKKKRKAWGLWGMEGPFCWLRTFEASDDSQHVGPHVCRTGPGNKLTRVEIPTPTGLALCMNWISLLW